MDPNTLEALLSSDPAPSEDRPGERDHELVHLLERIARDLERVIVALGIACGLLLLIVAELTLRVIGVD